jgi:inner membrane protein
MALARLWPSRTLRAFAVLSALAMLPDLDVIAFALHIPYAARFGHRGAAHSLAAAAAVALLAALAARPLGLPPLRAALFTLLAVGSHGLLDAMTDGGLGVALLWPFTERRYFLAWRPIPVAPIGARMLSGRGLRVAAIELVQFAPLFAFALWPQRKAR